MTSGLSNTNFQGIMTEASSKLKELLSLMNSENGSSSVSSASGISMNSVWDAVENTDAIANGTDEEKANAIVSCITNLLGDLSTKDASQANKDVNAYDKKISTNDEEASNISQSVDQKLQAIYTDIESGKVSIEEALKTIEKLGGDQGKIAKAQEKLEAQLTIIEDNKKIFNNKNEDPKNRQTALRAILGAASIINGLVAEVDGYKAEIQTQNTVVKQSSENISELAKGAGEVLAQGTAQLKEKMGNAQNLTQEAGQMQVQAKQKNAIGEAQVKIGEKATTGITAPVTAVDGYKYTMSGNAKINAGSELMKGSIDGLKKLTTSIGTMGGYLNEFTNFANGLGQYTEGVTALVGQYDQAVNPTITAIGSWQGVAEANEQLQEYIQQEFPEEGGSNGNGENNGNQTTEQKPATTSVETAENNEDKDNNEFDLYDSKTFTFDTNIFKKALEV